MVPTINKLNLLLLTPTFETLLPLGSYLLFVHCFSLSDLPASSDTEITYPSVVFNDVVKDFEASLPQWVFPSVAHEA
jgi:hypothetical protein